jgi:hypothetical protein
MDQQVSQVENVWPTERYDIPPPPNAGREGVGIGRAVSLIVFGLIRSMAAVSSSDMLFSSTLFPAPSLRCLSGLAGFSEASHDGDRFSLSPRIRTRRAIRASSGRNRREPPRKHYEPPRRPQRDGDELSG